MIPADNRPPSLQVFLGERLVFVSDGRWLHPLFDLEEFLKGSGYPPEELSASDRIVGKAAALLLARMGIRTLHAGILSRLGEGVLKQRKVAYRFDSRVDRIDCATEQLLSDIDDLEIAYRLLVDRARRPPPAAAHPAPDRPSL